MGCLSCGAGGIKPTTVKLHLNMKEQLIALGFEFKGSCNCHGGTSYHYDHPAKPNMRMEVGTSNYWVKTKDNSINYRTIDFGNTQTFNEALQKHFGF